MGLLLAGGLAAQREETLFNQTGMDFSGFWYSRTVNFSFLENDSEYFSGGNIGFEFGRSFIFGWGWQRMTDFSYFQENNARLRVNNSGLLLGYIARSEKVIHPYISVLLGGGRLRVDNGDTDRLFVIQPAGGFEVNAFRWMRIGLEGGYRLATDVSTPGVSNTSISSPFVQLQLRFGYSWGTNWW